MSLHNLELAREFLPRLVGLRDGRVVFDCASEEIGDEQFEALYTLSRDEMWRNGT
jgi:phosphonate transport system ATP-binding protein